MTRLSFDDWARLARHDPEACEHARKAAIQAFLATRPPARRQRLERLQWRIERERERCGTPLAACIHLSNMMWDRFAGPQGLAAAWQGLGTRARHNERSQVIPFPGGD